MPTDERDPTAITDELPVVTVGTEPPVFTGRAAPIVRSDVELAEEGDDHSVDSMPFGMLGGLMGAASDEGERLAVRIAHAALAVILSVPAVVIVAFGIALAAR
jgi:hypothetical protein